MTKSLLVVLITLMSLPAYGQYVSGNQLYEHCTKTESPASELYCLGFITGVSDSIQSFQRFTTKHVCLPANFTARQLKDVAVKHLAENPAERQYTAESSIHVALGKAFPCTP